MNDLITAAQKALAFCGFLWREVAMNDYAEEQRERVESALRAALDAQEQHDTDCHAQGICQRSGYSIGGPKPLTEDEIERLIQTYSGYCQDDFVSVARAVEREHGIGGTDDCAAAIRARGQKESPPV